MYNASEWDELIEKSKNGTFLFKRSFMDYHSDRFTDCSLIFEKKGKAIACFPANYSQTDNNIYSHQGLTYGGLVLSKQTTTVDVLEMFDLMTSYYKLEYEAEKIIYKPVPYIYNQYPSEEDLYCLYKRDAKLVSRGISSTIDLVAPIRFSELRRRCIQKGKKAELTVLETTSFDNIQAYWHILKDCLQNHHNVNPVHSADEMHLLMQRFPKNISLILSKDKRGDILAGVWLFKDKTVLHTQYLASSESGKINGALDLIIEWILDRYSGEARYLDFGISTEDRGHVLNEGLLFQKEGFGGRGVCYDTYEMDI